MLHQYSVDTEERRKVYFGLSIASIAIYFVFDRFFDNYQNYLPSWVSWVETPSVFLLYFFLFKIFDKWLWQFFNKIGFLKTPYLHGVWNGTLESSFDNHSSEKRVELTIFQTWTKIKVILKTDQSSSRSEVASLVTSAPEGKYLSYQYMNEPNSREDETMVIHRGTARLLFDENKNTLEGNYCSGRGRRNFGSMSFVRNHTV